MALIWVKENNKLFPIRVKTGLSDGSYTEVEGNVKVDEEIATAIVNNSTTATQATTTQTQNPFAPQMPRPGQGGGRGGR